MLANRAGGYAGWRFELFDPGGRSRPHPGADCSRPRGQPSGYAAAGTLPAAGNDAHLLSRRCPDRRRGAPGPDVPQALGNLTPRGRRAYRRGGHALLPAPGGGRTGSAPCAPGESASRPGGAGGEHGHDATGETLLPGSGAEPRAQGPGGAPGIEAGPRVHQGPAAGALSERNVFRGRRLRHRLRGQPLLPALPRPSDARPERPPGRHAPGADGSFPFMSIAGPPSAGSC